MTSRSSTRASSALASSSVPASICGGGSGVTITVAVLLLALEEDVTAEEDTASELVADAESSALAERLTAPLESAARLVPPREPRRRQEKRPPASFALNACTAPRVPAPIG